MSVRNEATPTIVVAVATFRRPLLLRKALEGLVREIATIGLPAEILVVDNDPDASAAGEVSTWSDRRVRYVHEAEPGISAARNRALTEARCADAIVFIDDDEVPTHGWLHSLVDAWMEWECAAVAGPVESEFAEIPDPWVLGIGIFGRRRRATGAVVRGAATNNLLLDIGQLRERNLTFDPQFGLSGGSDSMLTHRLSQTGGQIRWCDHAVVTETVPASRTSRRWVRRRLVRTSNSWARVQILLHASAAARMIARARLAGHALLVAGRGAGRYSLGFLASDMALRCSGERDMLNGLGVILGSMGVARYEYSRKLDAGSPPTRRLAPLGGGHAPRRRRHR